MRPVNRITGFYEKQEQTMVNAAAADGSPNVTEVDQATGPPPFARRFMDRMGAIGLGTPTDIVAALKERGVPSTERKLTYLRAADYKSPGEMKETAKLVKACADLAGCKVIDFFRDPPEGFNDPRVAKAVEALDGPKAPFLEDAIELAYMAKVASTPRR